MQEIKVINSIVFYSIGIGCLLFLNKCGQREKEASDNAFRIMYQGFQVRNAELDRKNHLLIEAIKDSYANNPKRIKNYLDAANKAMELTLDFVDALEAIKALVNEYGGEAVLFKSSKGKELKNAIDALRDSLIALPPMLEQDSAYLTEKFTLNTVFPDTAGHKSWESYVFENIPDAAVNAMLTKIQGDAKNDCSLATEELLKKISTSGGYDWISAAVIAPSSYLLTGDEYKADIFISKSFDPGEMIVYIGDFDPKVINDKNEWLPYKLSSFPLLPGYDSISVVKGMSKYSVKTTSSGLKKKSGAIKVKRRFDYEYEYYPFKFEYRVAEPCP